MPPRIVHSLIQTQGVRPSPTPTNVLGKTPAWSKEAILTLIGVCVAVVGISVAGCLAGPPRWLGKTCSSHGKR